MLGPTIFSLAQLWNSAPAIGNRWAAIAGQPGAFRSGIRASVIKQRRGRSEIVGAKARLP